MSDELKKVRNAKFRKQLEEGGILIHTTTSAKESLTILIDMVEKGEELTHLQLLFTLKEINRLWDAGYL
ncbi:hypothetical protein LJC15_01015 [Desulfovibrio sp. OttesenSCG-928-G11]|nr:hypothetical protein [Desulfovibrio sp. OttesenSCG-928-G11]